MTAPKSTRKTAAKTTTKPATPRTRKPAAPKPAPPAPAKAPEAPAQPTGLEAIKTNTARAAKAKATRDAATASGETRKCETCGETKPITKFPTTTPTDTGEMGRGKNCRACRDAKRNKK